MAQHGTVVQDWVGLQLGGPGQGLVVGVQLGGPGQGLVVGVQTCGPGQVVIGVVQTCGPGTHDCVGLQTSGPGQLTGEPGVQEGGEVQYRIHLKFISPIKSYSQQYCAPGVHTGVPGQVVIGVVHDGVPGLHTCGPSTHVCGPGQDMEGPGEQDGGAGQVVVVGLQLGGAGQVVVVGLHDGTPGTHDWVGVHGGGLLGGVDGGGGLYGGGFGGLYGGGQTLMPVAGWLDTGLVPGGVPVQPAGVVVTVRCCVNAVPEHTVVLAGLQGVEFQPVQGGGGGVPGGQDFSPGTVWLTG